MNETEKKPSLFSKLPFVKKLKSIKHFEIVVAVVLCSVMLLICFSSTGKSSSSTTSQTQTNSITYTNSSDYARELETKLNQTLSQIAGVGQVSAMVVLSSSSELIIAKSSEMTTKKETTSSGSIVENITSEETPLVLNTNGKNEPLILLEILPKIAGVVIVAQGADDVAVKLDILKAVQALFNVENANIEIIKGK